MQTRTYQPPMTPMGSPRAAGGRRLGPGRERRRGWWLGAILLAAGTAWPAVAAGLDITGPAKVIDGTTLEVTGRVIRLYGIDAPDPEQTCQWPEKAIPCGNLARLALMDLTTGAEVACQPRAKDERGRIVAICFAGGFDVGRNMVHTGWAVADREISTAYVDTEEKARQAKHGMWRGTFAMPRDWRRQHGKPR